MCWLIFTLYCEAPSNQLCSNWLNLSRKYTSELIRSPPSSVAPSVNSSEPVPRQPCVQPCHHTTSFRAFSPSLIWPFYFWGWCMILTLCEPPVLSPLTNHGKDPAILQCCCHCPFWVPKLGFFSSKYTRLIIWLLWTFLLLLWWIFPLSFSGWCVSLPLSYFERILLVYNYSFQIQLPHLKSGQSFELLNWWQVNEHSGRVVSELVVQLLLVT